MTSSPRRSLLVVALAAAFLLPSRSNAASLTAATVFSANAEGNNWNGLIWNTLGAPADYRGVWNLYWSSSTDPNAPTFLNGFDDARTSIDIPLSPGTYTFMLYGESAGLPFHPEQRFVLNLYFDGSTTPGISALSGPSCTGACTVSHSNGLDLFGNSGAPEAGTLQYASALSLITLVDFEWITNRSDIDKVWDHYHNTDEYPNGSGTPDFLGRVTLRVSAVPEPESLLLLGIALPIAARRMKGRF